MTAAADALMGIFGFKRAEGEQMKTIEQARRELFRKIFANAPYEFSMARYTEDSTSWPGNYVSYHVECAWQAFNAALAQSERVPEGWQLVPVEPTEAMLEAGYFTDHAANRGVYHAMLAASPSPSKQGGEA